MRSAKLATDHSRSQHPDLSLSSMQPPTSEERNVADIILQRTDKDSLAVLTGDAARAIQPLVHLPPNILGKIWNIVDQNGTGFLTFDQITQFVRLIGYAQTNEPLTRSLLRKPGPECRIDGWTHPKDKNWEQPCSDEEFLLLEAIIKENDKEGYEILDGPTAKAVLRRSGLPNETLGEIWDIIDDPPKGFLVATDLRKALRLISCAQRGLRLHRRQYETPCPLPDLDDSFVEPETPIPPPLPSRTPVPTTPLSSLPSAVPPTAPFPALAPQPTSDFSLRFGNPSAGLLYTRPENDPLPAITPAERKAFIGIFEKNNPINGVITGKQAIKIFERSKLPVQTLSQVWELADNDHMGTLTRSKFVVAMYLIKGIMDKRFLQLPPSIPPWLSLEASKDGEGNLSIPQPPSSLFSPYHAPTGFPSFLGMPPTLPLGGGGSSSQPGHGRSRSQPPAVVEPDLLDLENEIIPPVPPKAASAEQLSSPTPTGNSTGSGNGNASLSVHGRTPSAPALSNRPDVRRDNSVFDYVNSLAPAQSPRQNDEVLPPYSELPPTMRVQ